MSDLEELMQSEGSGDSLISRNSLAEKILCKAAGDLRRVGFSEEAVRDAFLRASGRPPRQATAQGSSEDEVEMFGRTEVARREKIYQVFKQFAELPETKSLRLLGNRLESLLDSDDPDRDDEGVEAVLSAIPLRMAAISWLRSTAEAEGVPIGSSRSDWILHGGPDAVAVADELLFIDQFDIGNAAILYAIHLSQRLLMAAEFGKIAKMLDPLLKDELEITGGALKAIFDICDQMKYYNQFLNYVLDVTELGEVSEIELIREFQRVLGRDDCGNLLQSWVTLLEAEGVIERSVRFNAVVVRRTVRLGGHPF